MEIKRSYTLKGSSITKRKVSYILNNMNPSSVTTGVTSMSVTETGGVHSSGKKIWAPSVMLEFPISRSYVAIALYGYPKGVIMHLFLPLEKNLSEYNQVTLVKLLQNLVQLLEENTIVKDKGFVQHDEFSM